MAADLDGGLGLYALVLDLSREGFPFLAPPVFHRLADGVRRLAPPLSNSPPQAISNHFREQMVEFGSVSQLFGTEAVAPIQERAWPFVDGVGLFAQDGEGAGIQIISPSPTLVRVHGRSRTAWRRLALHVGIAWRLRRRLERGSVPEARIENGKLVDARGEAKSPSARETLIAATRRIERARTAATREDPEQVLELWSGLVSGRWSLIDQWDSDGRRYVAAYENGATVGEVQGFAPWEVQILRMHLLRARPDEIGFALGMATSTVERVLSSVARRVGLRSRAELVRLSEPGLMTRLAIDVVGERIDVLRFDEPSLPAAWQARLTKAQREVSISAARGLSDGEIARARGSSIRTVSNLLAATYRILELDGRADLVRALVQRHPASEPHRLPDADAKPRLAR